MSHGYVDIINAAGQLLHQAVECGHIQWIGEERLKQDAPITCGSCPPSAGERTWRRAMVRA